MIILANKGDAYDNEVTTEAKYTFSNSCFEIKFRSITNVPLNIDGSRHDHNVVV